MDPIGNWIKENLERVDVIYWVEQSYGRRVLTLKKGFRHLLNLTFREDFPDTFSELLAFLFEDQDRITNFLSFCLQKYSNGENSDLLDRILTLGGSAYSVHKINSNASEYVEGGYELVQRVPEPIKEISERAITSNDLLQEAWVSCYSPKPNYEKVVSSCCDALEGIFKDNYYPNDGKPNLGKLINNLKDNPENLEYKGSNLVNPKEIVVELVRELPTVRGQHTNGTGKKPTKEEAEYALATAIYIWNLHN